MAEETIDPVSNSSSSPPGEGSPRSSASEGAADGSAMPMPDIGDGPDNSDVTIDPTAALEMLGDVDLDVKIELGRCDMFVGDVLRLGPGSIVELDKLAGDPVDVYVNERLVARGEVLVVNDNFCVRVNQILSAET